MKIKSALVATFLMVSVGLYAVAGEEPGNTGFVVLPVKGSETFKVIYKGESQAKVTLNLYDAKANLIFTESNSGKGFIRPLNFRELTPGEYTIEVVSATGKRVEKVVYQPKPSSNLFHVTRLADAQDKFLLSVKGNESDSITVKIYDDLNNLIHSEVKEVSGSFAQVYRVTNLKSAVTFHVSDSTGNVKVVSF